ncbi:MAG: phosphatidylserine decarboxylase family protein [Gemmatimonadales bacterium]
MSIAPEGRPFILGAAGILLALGVVAAVFGGWWFVPAGLWLPIALWVPWFFRDPPRSGPRGEHVVLAPADGRIVSVRRVAEPEIIGGEALRISVFMSVFDVHVNRAPSDGTVTHRRYHRGAFLNASRDKASEKNERMSLGIVTRRGPMVVRQIAGLVARRIVTDPQPGAPLRQGERLGLIRFGSRVDTFVPEGVEARVSPGDRVRAGVTVIAEWTT